MTSTIRSLAVVLAVTGSMFTASCAGDRPQNDSVQDWNSLTITLSRGVCFGACPDYTVEIHGDGRVVFEGRRFVAQPGRHETNISTGAVRSLMAKFRAVHFFSLHDEYRAQVTDLPTYRVTLAYDGRSKTVTDYGGGMMGMPQAVTEIENAIDEAANTRQWVKDSAH